MEHPIQGLMDTAMSNIKSMVDVNTIVGDAVYAPDGTVIIPISTVSFGFGAGGSEFAAKKDSDKALFGGGCGGGANVKPVAFLVVANGNIRILPISNQISAVDRVIDLVPEMVNKMNDAVKNMSEKREQKKQQKYDMKQEDQNPVVDVAE